MKILTSGCWHYDRFLMALDRHGDLEKASAQVIDQANAEADLFVHLGDMFQTSRPSPRAYAMVTEFISQLKCKAVFMHGNHDSKFYGNVDSFAPLRKWAPEDVIFLDRPVDLFVDNHRLLFLGHIRNEEAKIYLYDNAQQMIDRLVEQAKESYEEPGGLVRRVDAIFSHLDMSGACMDSGKISKGTDLHLPLDVLKFPCMVVNGHLHEKQKVEPNVWMPGSLVQMNFGERNQEKNTFLFEV